MYIGQTSRKLKERINEHIKTSKMQLDNRYNYPFYRAIRKYGENNLIWEIIDHADTQIELDEKEKYWIDYYNTYIRSKNNNGYNQTIGGKGQSGLIHSEESKAKIRMAEIGDNNAHAKLSKSQVLEIVKLSKQNKFSQVELSKLFNTSEGTISRILSGLRWSSVTGIKYKNDNSFLIYE